MTSGTYYFFIACAYIMRRLRHYESSVSFSIEKGKRLPNHSFEWIKNEVEKKKGGI
jgi:hypothetical protein